MTDINKRFGTYDNGTLKVRLSMNPWNKEFSEDYLEICIPVTFEVVDIINKALKEKNES